MYKAYIFPFSAKDNPQQTNPYIRNFSKCFGKSISFVNFNKPTPIGLVDLLRNSIGIDIAFLNWVENIPDRRFGLVQSFLFVLAIKILKIRRALIVFTFHNKSSHSTSRRTLKSFILGFTLRNATMVLTHASEGESFLKEKFPDVRAPVIVVPHPVDSRREFVEISSEPRYDLLMWGAILPYKGIGPFLAAVRQNPELARLRIKIVGKAESGTYFRTLCAITSKNVDLEDRFVEFDEIEKLTRKSRATLFTYQTESVLSSGVLMDALSLGSWVIGPCVGAFSDLEKIGAVTTYRKYEEISQILEEKDGIDRTKIAEFLNQNTWEKFGKTVLKLIEEAS